MDFFLKSKKKTATPVIDTLVGYEWAEPVTPSIYSTLGQCCTRCYLGDRRMFCTHRGRRSRRSCSASPDCRLLTGRTSKVVEPAGALPAKIRTISDWPPRPYTDTSIVFSRCIRTANDRNMKNWQRRSRICVSLQKFKAARLLVYIKTHSKLKYL